MSLADLKRSGRIKNIPVDRKQIGNMIEVARRDLQVAEDLATKNADWCYIVAYNSMLQMSRAMMFSYGYTAREEEQHKTAVEFAGAVLGPKEEELTGMLDRMRRKRHDVVYDEAGAVSGYEAKHALDTARSYLAVAEKRLKERLRS